VQKEKLAEGDYILTREGYVFEVKGARHGAEWYTAYLKYVTGAAGKLKVYPLGERFAEVMKHARRYLWYDEAIGRVAMRVLSEDIMSILKAREAYARLKKRGARSRVGEATLEMASMLESYGVSESNIGVSGSVSLGIERETSDIDLVVYGEKDGTLAYSVLSELRAKGATQPLSEDIIKRKYASIRGEISYSLFRRREASRVLQGMFNGVEYSIRLARTDSLPECRLYIPLGRVKGVYEVLDDRYSVFTPMQCKIRAVRGVNASEVFSLRIRDTEGAKAGTLIYVSGHIELCIPPDGSIRLVISLNDDWSYIAPGYAIESSR